MRFARLFLRLVVGGYFVGHGTQKLFGWFKGHGLDATAQMFESLGLRPGKRHAVAAGAAEATGGALLALGAATPLPNAMLISVMLTAINRVHLKNGPFVTDGGYEYNLVLIAVALALAETGPGPLSVDSARGRDGESPGRALLALLMGVAGAVGAHLAAGAATSGPGSPPESAASSEPTAEEAPGASVPA